MKFHADQQFEHDGVKYRILPGNRCEGDLVIEFSVTGWHRPEIAHTLILENFKGQVEENNYGANGKIKSGNGSRYLLDSIKRAMKMGWEVEAERIRNEVAWKKSPLQTMLWDIE